jgi:superfamily II DNA or RNA helicase
MSFPVGSSVTLLSGQSARILSLTTLFGQEYADVFLEPAGPIQRVLVSQLQPCSDPLTDLTEGRGLSAPLFIAKVAAHGLQCLISQPGVLSAANFRITPLPHQVLAVDFVLGQFKPRAMIADEVGLGKTIEAAMVYEELKLRRQAHRALVVAPAGLTGQWKDELAQKFGEKFVIMDRSLFAALREMHGKETNLWELHDQVITSLDFIKPRKIHPLLTEREQKRREEHNHQVFENMVAAGWDVVIIDEAHKLSKDEDGAETARYKIGKALSEAVPVFLLLTATPHQGKPKKFMYLLNLVDPLAFNSLEDLHPENVNKIVWRTRKRAAIDGDKKPLFKHRITDIFPVDRSAPIYDLERELYQKVSDYVSTNYNRALGRNDRAFGFLMILFQRMLTSSTQAITESIEKRLKLLSQWQESLEEAEQVRVDKNDFDEEEAFDLDAQEVSADLVENIPGFINRSELSKEILILTDLLKLARQALKVIDSKVAALMEIIDQVQRREGLDTKFLVFTEFIATQKVLKNTLEDLGYKVTQINGKMDLAERTISRQEFSGPAQFMISTDAGGEGVNLQFAHVLVNYDLPWNPMKLEQRIGRLDRIGQPHNVLVFNLLIAETVEQRVREVLENKLDIIRKQYGDDKLADILSTLQEEFQFDKLFMKAVAHREAQAADLEHIGEQIYARARQILDQDDLLLPQAQAELNAYEQHLVEVTPSRLRTLLTGYLAAHNEGLKEYSRKPGVYHFDVPENGAKSHYADVVFERQRAVEDDGLTYLHLNHPLIQRLVGELTDGSVPALAQLRLRADAAVSTPIPDTGGLWAIFLLRASEPDSQERRELVSIFLDAEGHSLPQIASALLLLTSDQAETAFKPLDGEALGRLHDLAQQTVEHLSADRFSEIQLSHADKIEQQRHKLEQYYRQQESAIRQIGIENIRLAKERELLDRRRADLDALEKSAQLTPALELKGMAWIFSK